MAQLRVVCAWCGRVIAAGDAPEPVSHGMCPRCFSRQVEGQTHLVLEGELWSRIGGDLFCQTHERDVLVTVAPDGAGWDVQVWEGDTSVAGPHRDRDLSACVRWGLARAGRRLARG